ncbi:SHOCT domain-containing protein [Streptomyces sp. NPDC060232]|uniref:SHOCT domain-containing protein n=1 Tax=Streptomyces sp. NPDC060232 TaxID=3347079 RepID=UPI003647C629
MFIRPRGVTVHAANRPAGSPLLRGLLARASGTAQDTAGAVRPDEPPHGPLPARPVRPPEPQPVYEPEPVEEPEPIDALYWDADTHREPGPTPPAGLAAELRQLADLAREGLLTPQEFTTAKARLLNG